MQASIIFHFSLVLFQLFAHLAPTYKLQHADKSLQTPPLPVTTDAPAASSRSKRVAKSSLTLTIPHVQIPHFPAQWQL